jgi:phosphoglycolate phosphatase
MKLAITDLDNTLYDWVTYFSKSFTAMVDQLVKLLDIDREIILDEFREVHRAHNNSEHPFAVLELPTIKERFAGESSSVMLKFLDPALQAFKEARNQNLKLYPDVESTLQFLREKCVPIIGHTESTAVSAYYKLEKLGIWQYFDYLYALDGNLPPHPVEGRGKRYIPQENNVEKLSNKDRKPNPKLLLEICNRHGVTPDESLYVGDSLIKDVSMAKRAGVFAVWAQYGTEYDRDLWSVLVRVTHWSDTDVAREAQLKEFFDNVQPDISIRSFNEIKTLLHGYPGVRIT